MALLSVDCKLFIAIRYTSILVLVISKHFLLSSKKIRRTFESIGNYGFFTTTFNAESCKAYYLLPLIFKGA